VFETSGALKIVLAVLVGAPIGAEREYRDRAAGLRTLVLICSGAALFTMLSIEIGGPDRNAARIAAQIVSGVGFLGAGVIMREGGTITGLTTAATIWLTAALGMGIGAGYYAIALGGAASIMVVLWVFPIIEARIDVLREGRNYRLVYPISDDRSSAVEAAVRASGLELYNLRVGRNGENLVLGMHVVGRATAHAQLVKRLLADAELRELTY